MSLLTEVLARPEGLDELNGAQWDELLRLARFARLLSRLHSLVEMRKIQDRVPEVAREVMLGASVHTDHMQLLVRSELDKLSQIFAGARYPVVLLKGAAYLLSGLPVAAGRRLNDIDILVPRENLEAAENLLRGAGWQFEETLTAYDQRYYREWSHEIPPMRHPSSPVELDVHHNLIQPTSRIKLDAGLLFAEIAPVQDTVFSLLSPTDMVLHSATHLFMSDELRGGLRDLVDMHMLCMHFSEQDSEYWDKLVARAERLGLQRPLYYAVSAMRRILHTPVPVSAWRSIDTFRPALLVDRMMRGAIDRHLAPVDMTKIRSAAAGQLLYMRSHWIRMPPLMLAKHLSYKWMMSFRNSTT